MSSIKQYNNLEKVTLIQKVYTFTQFESARRYAHVHSLDYFEQDK